MRILCIDIGNTSITYSDVVNGKPSSLNRFSVSDDLENWFNKLEINQYTSVVISSVAPKTLKIINNLFSKEGIDVFEVSYQNSGINLNVKIPSEVGNDRICNVVAAKEIYGIPSIVIDFGTATTYDIIDKNGNFIGGAISPGIDVSANNLIIRAELLKDVVYQFPDSIVGKDTISNIQSGVMFGGLHSIIGMINQIKEEIDSPSCNIVLTGGFGELMSDALKMKHSYDPYLTINGMLSIYKKNI